MAPTRPRQLRQQATAAERKLWQLLRNRQVDGVKFRRQRPIGRYVVDFVCIEKRLVVEVDGGQHAAALAAERIRTLRLGTAGFRVIRFWNNEVLRNPDGVVWTIRAALSNEVA